LLAVEVKEKAMSVLANLKPERVLHYFEDISKIPRESANEKEIADYLVNFATNKDLGVYRDGIHNVLIKKDGQRQGAPLILQAHTDMVCQKLSQSSHNFKTDALNLIVEGDYLRADGTTLGADNGAGVAMMLAVLEDDSLLSPPLECLFTSQEEIGLNGAAAFDYGKLSGTRIVNLDSSAFGKVLVSSAGGINIEIRLPAEFAASLHNTAYCIEISGLKGGHSGVEIHLNRANANKVMGRLLDFLRYNLEYELCGINGGDRDNVIPCRSKAVITVCSEDSGKPEALVKKFESILTAEYAGIEDSLSVRVEKAVSAAAFSKDTRDKAIGLLTAMPDGVITKCPDANHVETSSNLGIVSTKENVVTFAALIRSSSASKKQMVASIFENLASLNGLTHKLSGGYPGWQYNPDSKLRSTAIDAFKRLEGKELMMEAVHAGLECGIFADNIAEADIISIGPDMQDIHSPLERLSITSLEKTYTLLREIIEKA
jgi:dipeptidase D